MSVGRFAPVEPNRVYRAVAGVERGRELLQSIFLAGSFGALEQDDGAPPMGDLRQLQFRQMRAQRGKGRALIEIVCIPHGQPN